MDRHLQVGRPRYPDKTLPQGALKDTQNDAAVQTQHKRRKAEETPRETPPCPRLT